MQSLRKNNFRCPACGSHKTSSSERIIGVQAPYGPEVEMQEKRFTCLDCGEGFNYSKSYDNSYREALETSKKASVVAILEHLSAEYNFSAVERALDLPQRTLSRWKNTADTSAIGIALLRIVRTYPWILRVAEAKYEPTVARNVFIQTAVKTLLSIMPEPTARPWGDEIANRPQTNYYQLHVHFDRTKRGGRDTPLEECYPQMIASSATPEPSRGVWE
jgi:transposase-like protein